MPSILPTGPGSAGNMPSILPPFTETEVSAPWITHAFPSTGILPPVTPPPTYTPVTGGTPTTTTTTTTVTPTGAPSVSSPLDDCSRSVSVTGYTFPPGTYALQGVRVDVYINGILSGSATFTVNGNFEYDSTPIFEVPISGCFNVGDIVRATGTIN